MADPWAQAYKEATGGTTPTAQNAAPGTPDAAPAVPDTSGDAAAIPAPAVPTRSIQSNQPVTPAPLPVPGERPAPAQATPVQPTEDPWQRAYDDLTQSGQYPASPGYGAEANNPNAPLDVQQKYAEAANYQRSLPPADDYLAKSQGQTKLLARDFNKFWARADIGLSDSLVTKIQKFKDKFPGGDLKIVSVPPDLPTSDAGHDILMFRLGPKGQWGRFDAPGLTRGDLADVSGELPGLVASIAASVGTDGLPVLLRSFIVGGSATTGDLLKQGTEAMRGYPLTANDLASRELEMFLANSIGEAGSAAVSLTGRTLFGFGGANTARTAIEANQEASRLSLRPLFAGQLASNPIIRHMMSIAAVKGDTVTSAVEKQLQRVNDVLQGRLDPAILKDALGQLANYDANMRAMLLKQIPGAATDPIAMGDTLKGTWELWNQLSKARVSSAYDAVRKIGNLEYDTTDLKKWANEQLTMAQNGTLTLNSDSRQLLQEMAGLDDILMDKQVPVMDTPGHTIPIRPEDQLMNLRSVAWTISHPKGDVVLQRTDKESGMAAQASKLLYDKLTDPVTGFGTHLTGGDAAEFKAAVDRASAAARDRFKTQESLDAVFSATKREFQPIQVARDLYTAASEDAVWNTYRALKKEGMDSRWDQIVGGWKMNLLDTLNKDGPDEALKYLNGMSARTRALFLPDDGDLVGLRMTLGAMKRFQDINIPALLEQHAEAAKGVLDLVNSGGGKNIRELLRTMDPGTKNTVRMGLLDNLYRADVTGQTMNALLGAKWPNPIRMDKELAKLKATGAANFLTSQDIKDTEGFIKYLYQASPRASVGAGMAGGAAGGEALEILPAAIIHHSLNPLWATLGNVLEGKGGGWFITSGLGRYLLSGRNPGRRGSGLFRYLGLSMANMAVSAAKENNMGQNSLPMDAYKSMTQ